MNSKQPKATDPMIFANREGLAQQLTQWIGGLFACKPYLLICVSENVAPANVKFGFPKELKFRRALIVFEGHQPIDLDNVGKWRTWVMNKSMAFDLRMTLLKGEVEEETFRIAVEKACASWHDALPEREPIAIEKGSHVCLSRKHTDKDDPAHLTIMFGSMGDLLTQVDIAARNFRDACPFNEVAKKDYLSRIDKLLANKARPDEPEPQFGNNRTDLPRVLLRGETGVGKTLIARYLHQVCGFTGRPLRVSIPEYLGKEDMFEYDLFGYMEGAYTDGKKAKHGMLLENINGVVFFDEIGEANAILQAKLLAFLDDYRVRPRQWEGTPFYCPVLILAATNQNLHEMVKDGTFRQDLLARFTEKHKIPSLKDRMSELPFILDCLLQRDSLNSAGMVQQIGTGALDAFKHHGFQQGNFRELEDVFRTACQRASREGRNYLTFSDVPVPQPQPSEI